MDVHASGCGRSRTNKLRTALHSQVVIGAVSRESHANAEARVLASLRPHPSVLAYADAPPSDGGTGAVHVLLRK